MHSMQTKSKIKDLKRQIANRNTRLDMFLPATLV